MSIKEAEDIIALELNSYDDWMDKYNYIIESGKTLPVLDSSYKDEQHLITGCQSKVWLHAEYKEGKIIFRADSDAVITRGIINLLIQVLSDQTPDEILAAELDFVNKSGLVEHLSPTRSNGLASMIKQMKLYALVFKTKYGN